MSIDTLGRRRVNASFRKGMGEILQEYPQVLLVDVGFRKPLGSGLILRPRMENLTDINVFSSVCAEREREIKQSLSRRDCRLSANKSVRFLAGFSSLAAKATRGSVLIAKFVINWLGESRACQTSAAEFKQVWCRNRAFPPRETMTLFPLLAPLGNKNWPPSMKVKKLKIFCHKMGSMGCKWSSLHAPGTQTPLSHPILKLDEFPFPIIGPLG